MNLGLRYPGSQLLGKPNLPLTVAVGFTLGIVAGVEQAPLVLVVEEQAPYASGFLTMLEVEILITPALKSGIVLGMMTITGLLNCLMEMHYILHKGIVGG